MGRDLLDELRLEHPNEARCVKLVAEGATFDARDSLDMDALYWAVAFCRTDVACTIIDAYNRRGGGLDINNHIVERNMTVLMQAIENSDEKCVRAILSVHNLKLDEKNAYGETALDVAKRSGNSAITDLVEKATHKTKPEISVRAIAFSVN